MATKKLAVLAILAVALRIGGVWHGLPLMQVADESSDIRVALEIPQGKIPVYTLHRSIWALTQVPIHALHFGVLKLAHPSFSLADFEDRYFTHRGEFVASARLLMVFIAVLSVLAMYGLGRQVSGTSHGGLLAAMLLAVNPIHVYQASIGLPDPYALLWIILTLWFSAVIWQEGKAWAYWASGIGLALVVLTRFQVASLGLVPLGAHLLSQQPRWGRNIFYLAGGFSLGLLIFNPFIWLAPHAARADLEFLYHAHFGASSDTASRWDAIQANFPHILVMMRPYFLLALPAMWGLRRSYAYLIGGWALLFALSILPAQTARVTYWMPLVIPSVLLVSWQKWRTLYLIIFAFSWVESLLIATLLLRPTTRELGYEYVTQHIPAESVILLGDPFSYSLPLNPTPEALARLQTLGNLPASYQFRLENPASEIAYEVFDIQYRGQLTAWDDFLVENQVNYIIEADYCWENEQGASFQFPTLPPEIRSELVLETLISPFHTTDCQQGIGIRTPLDGMNLWRWERLGPIIRIYRVVR